MALPSYVRRLAPWLFVLPLFAAVGCDRAGQSPTEPTSASVKVSSTTAGANTGSAASSDATAPGILGKARGGNGNGHGGGGNGGGGNGGGGNGHGGHGGDLTFTISPDVWNTNWVNAAGNVQAFVRGTDAGKIDLGSITLGVDGGSDTLTPRSTRYAGGQVVATFSKSDAFKLLGSVNPGDHKTVTLKFTVGTGADATDKTLSDNVRIVGAPTGGDDGGGGQTGDLSLNIQPDDWNTNWAHSSGQVHAFIRGANLDKIDLTTVRLVGDKSGADPLAPTDVRRVGHQVVARFSMSAAYATLNDPHAGEKHTVKITFQQDGNAVELSEDIHVVGRQ